MVNFLFSAYFGGHFCHHSNGKSKSNLRLLHFGYYSNELIRTNWWKMFFYILASKWAKKPLMHVALCDSQLKQYKRYVLDTIIIQTRSEVKDKVTQKWYVTLRYQKMHSHTNFGIPSFNNIRDKLRTNYSKN